MVNPVPTLETARLLLVPISLDDAAGYAEHFVDYEVIRYLSADVPWPYPPGGVESFLSEVVIPVQGQDRWVWALRSKAAPEACIGAIDLWRDGQPEHRGFWLGRRFWGQGLMTEACEAVNAHAFEALGFEELIFANAAGNLGSRRVKEKTGAEFLGVGPGRYVDPKLTEQELWRLRRSVWQRRQALR
ncbi:MAG: GNAT family N-acetyltransferase [Myxococcota bacterium]|nr:GNAT family N-acetyltransferase [Myxococcota bacterium]